MSARAAIAALPIRRRAGWSAAAAAVAVLAIALGTGRWGAAATFEAAALAVLAVGGAVLAWELGPAWLASLGIAASVMSGSWQRVGLPLAFDRPLLLGALALAVIRYARLPQPRPRLLGPVHCLLALTALFAAGSAFWTGTLADHSALFGLLDRLGVVPFALFAAAPLIFPTARERAVLLGVLVATGAYLGLTALFEAIPLRSLVLPSFILDPAVGIHADRARGPFLEAAANGMALCACGAAAAVAAASWRGRRARAAAVAVAALCAAGVLFTLTRSAWVGAAAGAAAALLATPRGRRALLPAGAAAAALVVISLAVIPGLGQRASERRQDQATIWDRQNLTVAAVHMIGDRPLLGFGWGTFQRESADHFRQSDGIPLTGARVGVHNFFLSLAVELGVVGALCWLLAFGGAVAGGLRRRGPPELRAWRLGFVVVAVDWIVVANFIPLSFAFPTLVLWTWAGVLWAGGRPIGARA